MDYAIYKTVDGLNPRVIHTFTQSATNRRAKTFAKHKLLEMWARVASKPTHFVNAVGSVKDEFSYDMQLTTEKTVRIRFYIAKL